MSSVVPLSHTSTQEWQSFEMRMRRRRMERCVIRARLALDEGMIDIAREAIDEARTLGGDGGEVAVLANRLHVMETTGPLSMPNTVVEGPAALERERPRWRALGAAAALILLSAVTGWSIVRSPAPVTAEHGPALEAAHPATAAALPAPIATDQPAPPTADAVGEPTGAALSAPAPVAPEARVAAPPATAAERQQPLLRDRPAGTTGIGSGAPADSSRSVASQQRPDGHPGTASAEGLRQARERVQPGGGAIGDVREPGPVGAAASAAATDSPRPALRVPTVPAVPVTAAAIPGDNLPPPPALPVSPREDMSARTTGPEGSAIPVTTRASAALATSARPAGSGEPPAASPLPAAAAAVAPIPDERLIRATLGRYEAAYGALDAAAAGAVWPTVDRRGLQRAFDGLAAQSVALGQCDIRINGASARAECAGSARWTPRVGGGTQNAARRWRFDLRNTGGQWIIVDATVR